MKTYSYFVANQWRAPIGGRYFESENPADGRVWARVPDCDAEDLARAVAAAKDAYRTGPWGRMNPSARGRVLRRMGDVVAKNAARLAAIETRDNGKLPSQIAPALRGWLVESFHYYAGLADKFEGGLVPVDVPDMMNWVAWRPYGVVGLILPWNSPLGALIWKLAPALAAGNTTVIKPSELTSCSTLELMDVLIEADPPPGVLNVVTGDGARLGEPLVDHEDVGMISFTGGTEGGRRVAAVAARRAKPVVLELGGKSPQIVRADADLDLAANGVAAGVFPPAGQSCIAGARIMVQRAVKDAFTEKLVAVARKARVGPPDDPASQIGPIAHGAHYARVRAAIARAIDQGCAPLLDGRAAARDAGYYIGPTIFDVVASDSDIAQTEIFGPVVALEVFEDDEEAISKANATIYGLAAGIWTRDVACAIRMSARIEAGTVYINNYFNAAAQSPVGGMKQSGVGRENGIEGLRAYMQTQSVWLATAPREPDPFPESE